MAISRTRKNGSYNRRQNELRHFALNGLFDVFRTSKGEKITFPPPSPPCNVVPLFELPLENKKHPNFEWRGQRRGVILMFLKLPYLSTMSQQFCRRLYIFKTIIFYFLGQDKMMDKLNLTKEEKGKRF